MSKIFYLIFKDLIKIYLTYSNIVLVSSVYHSYSTPKKLLLNLKVFKSYSQNCKNSKERKKKTSKCHQEWFFNEPRTRHCYKWFSPKKKKSLKTLGIIFLCTIFGFIKRQARGYIKILPASSQYLKISICHFLSKKY